MGGPFPYSRDLLMPIVFIRLGGKNLFERILLPLEGA